MENGKDIIEMTPVKVNANSLQAYSDGLDAKLRLCQLLIKGGMTPDSVKSPEACLSIILMGQELGFSPLQALQSFAHIKGKVAPYAAALQAVAVNKGGRFTVIESTDTSITIKAERASNKWSDTVTFTMADATKAGLTGNPSWTKYPKQMMYARATTILARRGWPDAIGGLKTNDEIEEIEYSVVDTVAAAEKTMPADKAAKALTNAQKATNQAMLDNKAHAYDRKLLIESVGPEAAKKDVIKAIREDGVIQDIEAGRLYSVNPVARWATYWIKEESPALPDDLPDWGVNAFKDEGK